MNNNDEKRSVKEEETNNNVQMSNQEMNRVVGGFEPEPTRVYKCSQSWCSENFWRHATGIGRTCWKCGNPNLWKYEDEDDSQAKRIG